MNNITESDYQYFVECAHRAGKERLMLCSSGNLSIRNGDLALVSGTGSWLPNILEEQISVCDIASGEFLNGIKPSMESTFHLGILREREDVNVVLHFQSEYATSIACMKNIPDNFNVTAEIPCYLGPKIPIIPYLRPGSPELAKAVVEALKNHEAALLTNHGQVVCGVSFDDAFQKAVFFEMACRIMIHSKMNYNLLSTQDILDLNYYIKGKTQ